MKVLVTGAAGFIGMHLSLALHAHDHEVVGIDNLNGITYDPKLKYARLAHLGIETDSEYESDKKYQSEILSFYKLDLNDPKLATLIKEGNFDVIVNLAALAGVRRSTELTREYFESNVNGFMHILETLKEIKQCPRLIFASSSSVYGDCPRGPFKESDTDLHQVSVYAATKRMNETMAYTFSSLYKIDAIGLRFFTVYGPYGRPDMAPYIFTKAFLEDKEITLFNQGKLRRDFTFIDDIVQGIMSIIEGPKQRELYPEREVAYDVYNIGKGAPVELFDFVSTLEEVTEHKGKVVLGEMQLGDVHETFADVHKLEQDYGFRPNTSLKEGLSAFYKWYCSYHS